MGVVLLLGAGFSKWAADLPIARQLFDFAIDPFGPKEEKLLERLRVTKFAWDNANASREAEQFIAHALGTGGAYRDLVLWYVQRRLVAPFIWEESHAGRLRRHVLQVDEKRLDDRPGVRVVREFLARCNPDGIVTLNYDMLVEYALGSRRFHYGQHGEVLHGRGPYPVSQSRRPVQLTGPLPLLKLHGSISWDKDGRYADGRRGLHGRALIVAPEPEKTPPTSLLDVWQAAQKLLSGVSRIVAFGVAFNPYDEAIRALLRARGPYPVTDVLLIDPSPKVAAAQALWPTARVETALPPPNGDIVIRDWLHRAAT